jgi:hypothetical protein
VEELRVQYAIVIPDDNNAELEEQNFFNELADTYSEIERLTNHADGYDYALAVSSGIIAGMIDSFFVGEWDFARGKKQANIAVNKKIIKFAKNQPDYKKYCEFALEGKGGKRKTKKDDGRLKTAVEYLEWKFPIPGDSPWLNEGYDKVGNIIDDKKLSSKSHHLDDLSHHPTIVGLMACIIAQFNKEGTYVNRDNEVIYIPFSVDADGNIEGKTPAAKVGVGIIQWCFNVAKQRHGHLMSDLAGSKQTAGKGMGLPGTVLSMLKELSCLPCFKDSDFSQKLARAYQKGIGTEKGQVNLGMLNCLFAGADSKYDYRTEKAIKKELKRQTLPVAINEVVVRAFYFVRHFIDEMKEKGSLEMIDFKKLIPFNNRTMVRMTTIASGTLSAFDAADAAIRSALKSGGNLAVFGSNFILRVNFVGIGRFAMAVGVDTYMGARKARLELATMCGEVAVTALEMEYVIEEMESIEAETDEKISDMKQITNEIASLKF